MRWLQLAFLHWPVKASILRPLIPAGLELDTFDGSAWIGVVPFKMARVRAHFTPPVPFLSKFPELNVRTYVTHKGKLGIWFLSLDAASKLTVLGARWTFHLPYFDAKMQIASKGDEIQYRSHRTHRDAPKAEFVANYQPTGKVFHSKAGTLEHFLTARLALYSADRHGQLYRGDIEHASWPLQAAQAEIETNSMAQAAGVKLPDVAPLVYYADLLDVVAWPIKRVG
ncbi:MAG TPA: DUF2071 domain-containing protein [Humisphaera sp.]|jgi:hypothetical protein|nr:DUF2071 domain-containing protein [Humisphaera sp.]